MIAYVSEIMKRELYTIDAYDGLNKAIRIMEEKELDSLPVLKDGKLIGILTSRDMYKAHPNRIAADAMTKSVITVSPHTSLWEARLLFEKYRIKELLIVDDGKLMGYITDISVYAELGKHMDPLTGLYRTDYIYYNGIDLIEKGMEISLIFIDLDKFGQIDKDYGHAEGNVILKELGKLLKSHTYNDTFLCRFGGDEFIALTSYKLKKCKLLAEILLKAISTHNFPNGIKITASAGIAGGRRYDSRPCNPKETVSDLINLASLASTKAKREKVKIVVADGFCSVETA